MCIAIAQHRKLPQYRERFNQDLALILKCQLDQTNTTMCSRQQRDNTLLFGKQTSKPKAYRLRSHWHCCPPCFTISVATTIPAPTKNPNAAYLAMYSGFVRSFIRAAHQSRPCPVRHQRAFRDYVSTMMKRLKCVLLCTFIWLIIGSE